MPTSIEYVVNKYLYADPVIKTIDVGERSIEL